MVLVTDGEQSFVLFSFGDINWGPSSYIGFIFPEVRYRIPGDNAILEIEATSNVGIPGLYAFRVDQRNIIQPRSQGNY